jgi:hypothetical protein
LLLLDFAGADAMSKSSNYFHFVVSAFMDTTFTPSTSGDVSIPEIESSVPNLDELKATAEQALKDARVKWEALLKEGHQYVKENPGKSVIAALGVGFILGMLFRD